MNLQRNRLLLNLTCMCLGGLAGIAISPDPDLKSEYSMLGSLFGALGGYLLERRVFPDPPALPTHIQP